MKGVGDHFPGIMGYTVACLPPLVMGCTVIYLPMHHGLYSVVFIPCIMGCTVIYPHHTSWTVQQYICPTYHGLYSTFPTSQVMGCTVVHPYHVPWTVQQYIYFMLHGLYNSIPSPCTMNCTTSELVRNYAVVDIAWSWVGLLPHVITSQYISRVINHQWHHGKGLVTIFTAFPQTEPYALFWVEVLTISWKNSHIIEARGFLWQQWIRCDASHWNTSEC